MDSSNKLYIKERPHMRDAGGGQHGGRLQLHGVTVIDTIYSVVGNDCHILAAILYGSIL